jgi:hypothetical protein
MSRCLQIIQHVLRLYCVRARELLRTSRNLKEELEAPITLYKHFDNQLCEKIRLGLRHDDSAGMSVVTRVS